MPIEGNDNNIQKPFSDAGSLNRPEETKKQSSEATENYLHRYIETNPKEEYSKIHTQEILWKVAAVV